MQSIRCSVVGRVLWVCVFFVGGCSSAKTGSEQPSSRVIGPAGGTLTTPDGVTVEVPPGALAADTTITISPAAGPVELASATVGAAHVFGPSGLSFAKPVLITLPFDSTRLPGGAAGADVRILGAADGSDEFLSIGAVPIGVTKVGFATTHFSVYVPAIFRACAPPGAAAYDVCGIVGCRPGFHAQGNAQTPGCDPRFPGLHCVPNGYPEHESTEAGCAPGYHFVGHSRRFSTAMVSSRCVATEGVSYDACELGCSSGYRQTDVAQGIDCSIGTSFLATVQAGAHCVSTSGTAAVSACMGGTVVPTGSGLAGTWDVTASGPGVTENAVIAIGTDVLSLTINKGSIVYQAHGTDLTVTYTEGSRIHVASGTRVPAPLPLPLGLIPLEIGGSSSFADPNKASDACVLEMTPGTGTFHCSNNPEWPDKLPEPRRNVVYTAKRAEATAPSSQFGDLGGTWALTSSIPGPGCTLSFVGNKMSGTCPPGTAKMAGSFEATFAASLVSGSTSKGIQFAGRKR
jgi:hypothetical protein